MNGNFLWQLEMRHGNSPRHIVDSFLNTGWWTAGRNLLPLNRYLRHADIEIVGMCRLFLRPLRYVWFYVFAQMILSIEAFATFRANLKRKKMILLISRAASFVTNSPLSWDHCEWLHADLNVPCVWTLYDIPDTRTASPDCDLKINLSLATLIFAFSRPYLAYVALNVLSVWDRHHKCHRCTCILKNKVNICFCPIFADESTLDLDIFLPSLNLMNR